LSEIQGDFKASSDKNEQKHHLGKLNGMNQPQNLL